MQTARALACSTLLADGRLLIAGGEGAAGELDSVEIYGTDGTFHSAGRLSTPRADASCVTLPDGRVLVSGGTNNGKPLASAEIFDPSRGSWRRTGAMHNARTGLQMAVTSWGTVVVAGGESSGSVEIYNPAAGVFQPVGRLSGARLKGVIAALPGQRVAFLGGSDGSATLASVDIYDGAANTVKPAGAMLQARRDFAAAALADGRVWISGGLDSGGNPLATTEIFDPALGVSSGGPDLPEGRSGHAAYTLPHNNGVLVIGGRNAQEASASALLYTFWNGNLTPTAPMQTFRHETTASPIGLGSLMVAGGRSGRDVLASGEIFRFPTIQATYQSGGAVAFVGTGWTPGQRVALDVVSPSGTGSLFSSSGVADRSGSLQVGGFDASHTRSTGPLQIIASGGGSQALDPMIPGDNTSVGINSTVPLDAPPPQYGNAVTFNGGVSDTSNPGTLVNAGTVSVIYNSVAVPNGTVPVDSNGNFSFTFDNTTEYLLRGSNSLAITFQYSGSTGGPTTFFSSSASVSYTIAPRTLTFTVTIGQPGNASVAPPPGNPATVTASTPQFNGSFPCGIVQLCTSNSCGGSFQSLANGTYTFNLPGGLTDGAYVGVNYQDTCDGNFATQSYLQNQVQYTFVFPTTSTAVTFVSGTTLVSSISFGEPIAWIATVNALDICTGNVQFVSNGIPVGSPVPVTPGAVSGCTASFNPGALPVGQYIVTANYSGDLFNPPSSGTNVFDVTPTGLPPLGGNNRIQLFTASSNYSAMFGSLGNGSMQFHTPCGLAVNPVNNNIFITDFTNSRIEMWSSTGQWIGYFGNPGSTTGHMLTPCGLAFAPNGNLYVADTGNNRIDIFTPNNPQGTSWNFSSYFGGQGSTNGNMLTPFGIAILPGTSSTNFTVYVADTGNNRVDTFTAFGSFLGTFGQVGAGNGQFVSPTSLAFTLTGNLLVVDFGNNRVEIFSKGGAYLAQFGGTGGPPAQLNMPFGIAVSPQTGAVMVTDTANSRIAVYSATGGYMSQFGVFGTGHGQFEVPLAIAFMPNGSQIVSESGPALPTGCQGPNCGCDGNDCTTSSSRKGN